MKKIFPLGLLLALLFTTPVFAQNTLSDDNVQQSVVTNDLFVGESVDLGENLKIFTDKGAYMQWRQFSALVSPLSGATTSATNLIPAGTVVQGCVARVTTLITSGAATSFKIGDGSDDDKWGATIAFAAGTKTTSTNFTAAGPTLYTSDTSVVLTPNTGTFTAGAVRITCFGYRVVGSSS